MTWNHDKDSQTTITSNKTTRLSKWQQTHSIWRHRDAKWPQRDTKWPQWDTKRPQRPNKWAGRDSGWLQRDADEQRNTQEAQRQAKETQNKQKHTQSDHKAMGSFCNDVSFSLRSLAPVWEGWWTFYKSVWLYGVTDSSYLFIAINIKILKLELFYYSELLCLVHHCLQHGPFFTNCTDENLSSKLCSSLPEYVRGHTERVSLSETGLMFNTKTCLPSQKPSHPLIEVKVHQSLPLISYNVSCDAADVVSS